MTPPEHTLAGRPEIVTETVDAARPGWIANATSSDHKAVGRMFIAASLVFLAAAATLLVIMRAQLMLPDATLLRPDLFDGLLSIYGVTAVLLFAMPLFMGLMTFVVPLQIGARGVALPRIGALSFWLWLMGALTIYASLLYTPSQAGTFNLPPLSNAFFAEASGSDAWAAGVGLISLALILFAVNMATTVAVNRAPGMVWRRVPLFSFASTVVSWTLLVVAPIMLAATTMLIFDRNFDGTFLDPGEGGAPLLYQHLNFIFFSGIYVSLVVLALGVVSEIFSTFSRQPHFGHRAMAGSMVAFATLGVLAWMQNMYALAIPRGFLYFAMLMAIAALVPVGLIVVNWIATLRGGRISVRPPVLFAAGAAVLLIAGLLGEWAQSMIPVGWQLADTMVAWGDTHLALIGAGLLGGFAALHHWFPKISGRYMGGTLGGASLWLIVGGALLMVVPAQLAGLAGMPADVYKFFGESGLGTFNLLASLGALVLAVGVVIALANAAASYGNGTPAGPDPWGGSTLEWFAPSPPPPHNFDVVPDVRSSEPFRDIREAVGRRATELELPPAQRPQREPIPVGAPEPEAEEEAATPAEPEEAAQVQPGEAGDEGAEDIFGGTSKLDYPEGERSADAGEQTPEGGESPDDEDDGSVA